ncbi:MAG: hypothetical protein EBQ67_04475 [Sphingobacteriia bacterium]|nr:hypothetical protein [Sphingobacteriia bacterium]
MHLSDNSVRAQTRKVLRITNDPALLFTLLEHNGVICSESMALQIGRGSIQVPYENVYSRK